MPEGLAAGDRVGGRLGRLPLFGGWQAQEALELELAGNKGKTGVYLEGLCALATGKGEERCRLPGGLGGGPPKAGSLRRQMVDNLPLPARTAHWSNSCAHPQTSPNRIFKIGFCVVNELSFYQKSFRGTDQQRS